MSKPLRILLDMDEVLCEWSSRIVELWNHEHREMPEKQVREVTAWNTHGLLGHHAPGFVLAQMRDHRFWENLKPVCGAIEGVNGLVQMGHEIRIVTQVLPEAAGPSYAGKLAWLATHLPWFDLGHVIVTKDKASVKGHILLDDAPHQLEANKRRAVALDYAWNRHVQCDRVLDWGAFLEYVRSL